MAQNGKLMPNFDKQSTKLLNLTVLQRIDPFVKEVLMTAAHVTFYEFNIELNQWSRKDVEGSLFVVKRNTQPRFQFIVMNRRSTVNLVQDLLGDFEYEVQAPYLLYRNAAQEVNGIRFYNSQDCEDVANLFSSTEFAELEAVPSLYVIEGPLEPARSSTAASVADVPASSFMNFFSTAMNIGNAQNATVGGQLHPSSATIPLPSSHTPNAIPFTASVLQPAPLQPASSTLLMPLLDAHESSNNSNRSTNLVKPSLFSSPSSSLMMPPTPSSVPTAPPLHPPVTMQHSYGTPLLQPFPPPNPPPSLTPAPNGPVITKDKVCEALLRLVQNNQFIDMVYREMLNAHYQ